MCVCTVHMYACVDRHVWVYMCVCAWMRIIECVYGHGCVCVCVCTVRMYVCVCIGMYGCICACVCGCVLLSVYVQGCVWCGVGG